MSSRVRLGSVGAELAPSMRLKIRIQRRKKLEVDRSGSIIPVRVLIKPMMKNRLKIRHTRTGHESTHARRILLAGGRAKKPITVHTNEHLQSLGLNHGAPGGVRPVDQGMLQLGKINNMKRGRLDRGGSQRALVKGDLYNLRILKKIR
jgi:hypothetical protein